MKLHEQSQARMNLVARYGSGEITINGRMYPAPLVVAPDFLHHEWIATLADLGAPALEPVWSLQPRIVLLGSAERPPEKMRELRALFANRQVALEAMDLGAACRTYNVLAQEDRAAAALLFP
jgi:uncharacterized protein